MSQSRSRDTRMSARRGASAHSAKEVVSRARSRVSRYLTPPGTENTAEGFRRRDWACSGRG